MRTHQGAELAAAGLIGAVAGVAGLIASSPALGLLAGLAAAVAGGLGLVRVQPGNATAAMAAAPRSPSDAPDADELAEELALAKVRENALQERITMLENAARAAATASLVGLAPAGVGPAFGGGSAGASIGGPASGSSGAAGSSGPSGSLGSASGAAGSSASGSSGAAGVTGAGGPAGVAATGGSATAGGLAPFAGPNGPVGAAGAFGPIGPIGPPVPLAPGALPASRPGQGALLTDPSTGLFSESYFDVALEARIAAARRRLRPVALVLLDVVDGVGGGDGSHADPAAVTHALRRTLREADTACRLDDGRFALVLEDTPENGAIWTVERVRSHLSEGGARCTVWAGVACYPAHAFDKEEILNQAKTALTQAREWSQDRIEVAQAE